MDLIQKALQAQQPIATFDAVLSSTIEKTQSPMMDTFGPYPDETILASLDRLLYALGARRLQKFFSMPIQSTDGYSTNSECSLARSQLASGGTMSGASSSPMRPRKKCCPHCCCRSTDTNAPASGTTFSSPLSRNIEESANGDTTSPRNTSGVLKRSFSLCSLVCRKLKQKLTFQTSKESTPKWLWTRVQCHVDGTEIYEIFHDSSICMHPSQIDIGTNPRIIFVVLANGVIVPFEVLKCH